MMIGTRTENRTGSSRWARARKRLLIGALGVTAAACLLPVRVGVVMGHSMDPTLHTGQLLAVDRSYYRNHPLTVGDVVLFRGEHGVYVKRVYAVAGQTVNLLEESDGTMWVPVAPGAEQRIAARLASTDPTRLRSVDVPAGRFFALGDALQNSEDSRDFGPVSTEQIIGRVLPLGASLAAPDLECHDVTPAPVAHQQIASAAL
jgi:signal peptidase I